MAAAELGAALILARFVLSAAAPSPDGHGHIHDAPLAFPRPGSWEFVAGAALIVGVFCWLKMSRICASLVAAAGLVLLAASPLVRTVASNSHLAAMVALEALMVAAPLLALRGLRFAPARSTHRLTWTTLAVMSAIAYAVVVVVIHLPAVHHRAASAGRIPLWVPLVLLSIGVAYWFAVLRTAGCVSLAVRRAMLVGAQEVVAFVGLLSMFGAWSAAAHRSSLGLSAAWDQRLGGIVMLAVCAAAAIPILRKFQVPDA